MHKVIAAPLTGLKLPFHFDPARLHNDLALVAADEWSQHYNERDFGGEWRGVALRSATGKASDLFAAPPVANPTFRDTPVLARCAYFREALALFRCPLKSVRLLTLEPGSFIREHCDNALQFEDGEIRIHIPVQTNPSVEFYVCGERLLLAEGECYYVNVHLPHRVNNRGASPRVHLVIDAEVNDWMRDSFSGRGVPIERSPLPPGSLEEFRKLVLREGALQAELLHLPDRLAFIARTTALGAQLGFDFHESDVDAGFRSNPTPLAEAPAGWTLVKVRNPDAEWIYTGPRRFTEPFFEDTVRACLRNPFAGLFRVAAPLPSAEPAPQPRGFIFHMSRCGSTLISQMLVALPAAVVLSEAPPIDEALQSASPVKTLRSVIRALGPNAFIKFDSWHIHNLATIRAAFPTTPWVFMYRSPVEVMVSLFRIPGRQIIPGALDPERLGLTAADVTQLTRTQWCARVLAGFLRRALEFREDANGLFVNYNQLPDAVPQQIARHFGLTICPNNESRMREAGKRDAKNSSAAFSADSQNKQDMGKALQGDPELAVLNALYRELEIFASALPTRADCSARAENRAEA